MSEVPPQRSYNMSRIRSRNTTPERVVRQELWHQGYRYRLNDKRLPGKPDLVLPKYRAVIFINSCFWHGHRGCPKYVQPKANAEFWREKIARNIARDELNAQRLDTLSWTVITVWECELTKKNRESHAFALEQSRRHKELLGSSGSGAESAQESSPVCKDGGTGRGITLPPCKDLSASHFIPTFVK